MAFMKRIPGFVGLPLAYATHPVLIQTSTMSPANKWPRDFDSSGVKPEPNVLLIHQLRTFLSSHQHSKTEHNDPKGHTHTGHPSLSFHGFSFDPNMGLGG